MDDRPIGVFDSGVGGLTVVRALIDLLPNESIIYYGDTARGPYGPLEGDRVRGYVAEVTDLLVKDGVKMLVAACNSASSAGLDHVRDAHPELPLVEVIEPASRAAVEATRNGTIGVIGTALTIASGAYDRAIEATGADVALHSAACPKFVEFVERGQTGGAEIIVAHDYLAPLLNAGIDTLILGCTHYPLLTGVISFVVGREIVLISSAEETARDVFRALHEHGMAREASELPTYRFLSSGERATFEELGRRFLGPEITTVEEQPWN